MNHWTYLFLIAILGSPATSSPQFGGLPCSGGGCGNEPSLIRPINWGNTPCSGGGCGNEYIQTASINRPNWGNIPCSGGGCGSEFIQTSINRPNWGNIPCSGGGCGREVIQTAPLIRPNSCSGGNCNSGVTQIRPPVSEATPLVRPNTSCFSCMKQCANQCSSSSCFNNCLNNCNCNDNERSIDEGGDNCCYVTHPRTCYTEEETGNKRCFTRRHRECSDLCSSSAVAIQEREGSYQGGCQYIRNYPYVYCGNYERLNCGSCYTCDGKYNPRECSRRSECSEGCRRSGLYY